MEDLKGRVVIVSNADSHDGAALARTLCEAGAAAVLTGDRFHELGALAAELHDETGSPIAVFAGDLTRDDERRELASIISELFPN
jgi:NAD(P)-dependent dehydrogenase (short-subunit alcohol dehydrogenase family)